ncbi:hypothetical protein VCRA2113O415_350010 [Vibrio crassostreae]|nr:hypothetical protein VCRA2113O415_350010 [Vibrio crassostreae]CAK2801454.1 hypothetical protein VCRA2113O420_340010 [Vibrio crassostreae]CAK3417568.1 hypothetical protein VCRA2121O436_350010 [Vibrio crassostreae]
MSSLQVEIAQIQTQQQLLPEQHNLKLLEIQLIYLFITGPKSRTKRRI